MEAEEEKRGTNLPLPASTVNLEVEFACSSSLEFQGMEEGGDGGRKQMQRIDMKLRSARGLGREAQEV